MRQTELERRMIEELTHLLSETRDGQQPSNVALDELIRRYLMADIKREKLDLWVVGQSTCGTEGK